MDGDQAVLVQLVVPNSSLIEGRAKLINLDLKLTFSDLLDINLIFIKFF